MECVTRIHEEFENDHDASGAEGLPRTCEETKARISCTRKRSHNFRKHATSWRRRLTD
ncbi:hypothetical protein BDV12DRAFT_181274 [Aspergillus spectabilis]